ncbi:hypothetical protein GCM10027589_43110 [Actinocorallia lasiicapitis]
MELVIPTRYTLTARATGAVKVGFTTGERDEPGTARLGAERPPKGVRPCTLPLCPL